MEQKQKSRKKYVVISVLILFILFVVFMRIRHDRVIGVIRSEGDIVSSTRNIHREYWTVFTGQTLDGSVTRTRHFSARDLEHFVAHGGGETGTQVYLTITQGENTKTVDLPNYRGRIDMSGFSPGRISLKIRFINAGSADATVAWGQRAENLIILLGYS